MLSEKFTSTLTLANEPLVQVTTFVGSDYRMELKILEKLLATYRIPNNPLLITHEPELESLKFDQDEKREGHVQEIQGFIRDPF